MRRFAPMAIALTVACTDPGAPRIDGIEPTEAARGARVVVTGANFCGEDGDCDPLPAAYVSFGIDPQVDGAATAWTDDRIEVIVPQAASGTVLVVVTVDGRSSNGVSFTVR